MTEPTEPPSTTLRVLMLERAHASAPQTDLTRIYAAIKPNTAVQSLQVLADSLGEPAFAKLKMSSGVTLATVAAKILQEAHSRPMSSALSQLAANGAFQSAQRGAVFELLLAGRQSTVFPRDLATRGSAILRIAEEARRRAAQPSPAATAPMTDDQATYGSHELTPWKTLELTGLVFAVVQFQIGNDSVRHQVETYLLTLFLMTLIWCALAVAP